MLTENYRIKPLGTRLIVKRYKRETTAGGIYIPETKQGRSLVGQVIAVGPDCEVIKPGDMIFYGQYSGENVDLSEPGYDDHLIMNEGDVLGVAVSEEAAQFFEYKEAANA